MYQLFRSLAYIHSLGICHRDIKPQNLLLDPETGILKLCDFGSAKHLVRGEPNVSYICSRYYRAPELIFGAIDYTTKIDVWSAGCVLAELLLGQPIFPGDSGVDQLVEIIKVLGTPTREQIREMNPNYTEFKFPQIKSHPWQQVRRFFFLFNLIFLSYNVILCPVNFVCMRVIFCVTSIQNAIKSFTTCMTISNCAFYHINIHVKKKYK